MPPSKRPSTEDWRRAAGPCALLLALVLGGCHLPSTSAGGRISFAVRFPQAQAYRLQVIPDATRSITVRVTGDRIPVGAVLAATLTPDKPSVTFEGVPPGWKSITARCLDANEAVLAQGSTTVLIESMRTAQANILLQPESEEGGFSLILQ